jgi:hypothetical protein
MLATDDEDDAVAVAWQPGASPHRALILDVAQGDDGSARNKIIEYDGAGFSSRTGAMPAGALLGMDWHPDGRHALLCGERGALLHYDRDGIETIASGVTDNLIGPFWHPTGASALLLKGPDEKVYTV